MAAPRAARLVALDWMLEQAANGEHETHGRNRSPLIDKINTQAGVPLGSPYCAAAAYYAFLQAGITDFGGRFRASVGFVEGWARDRGWLQSRPLRGDGFCWKIGNDSWPDHFGMVVKVRSWGGVAFTIDTVEANTSSGDAGSQDDGGGWHLRTRSFVRGRVSFVRDPRASLADPYWVDAEATRQRLTALRAWFLARRAEGWSWTRIKATHNWTEYKEKGGK